MFRLMTVNLADEVKERVIKMNKILKAVLQVLLLIHEENILIMATLVGKDVDDKYFEPLRENFDNIMKDIRIDEE